MANKPKPCHLIPFICLIFLLLAPIGNAKRNTPSDQNSSPFDFVKKLKGFHKGKNTKEVHELKAYLKKFGYLENLNKISVTDDNFDDDLELAIKTYQKNFQIKPSGIIDDETISKMMSPRCGVPDIINGTNYMQRHSKSRASTPTPSSIHTVSHYNFFPADPWGQYPRWPQTKTHLTYRFQSNVPPNAIDPVARAFQQWEAATQFSFSRVGDDQNADLVIGFYRGDHGDGAPFDGPRGILAHSFRPTIGMFHYDGDETWSVASSPNAFHLESVAVHEIGHLLGLGHSTYQEAIMYPTIGLGEIKTGLNQDDIEGIEALYNS